MSDRLATPPARGDLENKWHARYEGWAAKYHEDHLIAGWSAAGLSRRLALVLHVLNSVKLKPGSLILDLGAGTGAYTRAISRIGHRCVGLDYSRKVIEVAKSKGADETYVQGEAYSLPFRGDIFDAVVCVGVLQSLAHPESALQEMARVLAPGAHLFLDGLNGRFWVHLARSWKEAPDGQNLRMSYANPYELQRAADRIGFSAGELYWLTAPKVFQGWFADSGNFWSSFRSRLLGHAFLLHERKSYPAKKFPIS